MPPPSGLLVADASVIIDLYTGDLLELLGGLSFGITIPDLIAEHELLEPDGERLLLEADWIEAREIPGGELAAVQGIQARHRALTIYDASALYLAQTIRASLLTRDRRLERAARQYGIDVLDTFWLMEQMLQENLVTPAQIVTAVARMQTRDNFLPESKTKDLLARWGLEWDS